MVANNEVEPAVAVTHTNTASHPKVDTLKKYFDKQNIIFWEGNDASTYLGKRICRP